MTDKQQDPNLNPQINIDLPGFLSNDVKQVRVAGNRVLDPVANYQYHWLRWVILPPNPKHAFDDVSRYFFASALISLATASLPLQIALLPIGIGGISILMLGFAMKEDVAKFSGSIKLFFIAAGIASGLLINPMPENQNKYLGVSNNDTTTKQIYPFR